MLEGEETHRAAIERVAACLCGDRADGRERATAESQWRRVRRCAARHAETPVLPVPAQMRMGYTQQRSIAANAAAMPVARALAVREVASSAATDTAALAPADTSLSAPPAPDSSGSEFPVDFDYLATAGGLVRVSSFSHPVRFLHLGVSRVTNEGGLLCYSIFRAAWVAQPCSPSARVLRLINEGAGAVRRLSEATWLIQVDHLSAAPTCCGAAGPVDISCGPLAYSEVGARRLTLQSKSSRWVWATTSGAAEGHVVVGGARCFCSADALAMQGVPLHHPLALAMTSTGLVGSAFRAIVNGINCRCFARVVEVGCRRAGLQGVALDYCALFSGVDVAAVCWDLLRGPAGWRYKLAVDCCPIMLQLHELAWGCRCKHRLHDFQAALAMVTELGRVHWATIGPPCQRLCGADWSGLSGVADDLRDLREALLLAVRLLPNVICVEQSSKLVRRSHLAEVAMAYRAILGLAAAYQWYEQVVSPHTHVRGDPQSRSRVFFMGIRCA